MAISVDFREEINLVGSFCCNILSLIEILGTTATLEDTRDEDTEANDVDMSPFPFLLMDAVSELRGRTDVFVNTCLILKVGLSVPSTL